ARRDHRVRPPGDLGPGHAVEQDRHGHGGHLLVRHHAARVGVDEPVDLRVAQGLRVVALGPDDVDGVERLGRPLGHDVASRTWSRLPGPKACGSTSVIGRTPCGVSTSRPGPPCSQRSWRHRPHGMIVSPSTFTQVNDASRPPPDITSALTSEHSAHSVTPEAAFSMFAPVSRRPAVAYAAAPTLKSEYG